MATFGSISRTRSLVANGIPDQYADGNAAKIWELYAGAKQERTQAYRSWFIETLKLGGCHTVLDVACGNGVDSVMLIEEGFRLVSTDASDKMLKKALKIRWERRKEELFDNWIIEEANWLTLLEDLEKNVKKENIPIEGFDAIICLGNSFSDILDVTGSQTEQRQSLSNFNDMLKPGGILIIDHRNFDTILDKGKIPPGTNIYYSSDHIKSIKTSNLYVDGKPSMITMDFTMDMSAITCPKFLKNLPKLTAQEQIEFKWSVSCYPHNVNDFKALLQETFTGGCHKCYGDFKQITENYVPVFYIHFMQKAK